MAFAQIDLKKILSSAEMLKQINVIRGIGEHRLREAIWDTVYASYSPKEYRRTFELLNSVSSEFKIDNNKVEIYVFCDSDKMNHFANKPYGMSVYVPVLLDSGHIQKGYEGTNDMYHDYPKRDFLNEAIEEIQKDMNKVLLKFIVRAIRSKKAY